MGEGEGEGDQQALCFKAHDDPGCQDQARSLSTSTILLLVGLPWMIPATLTTPETNIQIYICIEVLYI